MRPHRLPPTPPARNRSETLDNAPICGNKHPPIRQLLIMPATPSSPTKRRPPTHWWGDFEFALDQTGLWRIGPMSLALTRLQGEWRVQYAESASMDDDDHWSVDFPGEEPDGNARVDRHFFHQTAGTVALQPKLADRAVVTRPANPLHLPPGEQTRLFVGSPVWIEVHVQASKVVLFDAPIQRPSDTWFGPSTWEGEMCYASRTQARLRLDEIPLRPHRAVTAVKIHNRGDDSLLLEKIKLPVRHFTLYALSDGMLWTNDLSVSIEKRLSTAELHIEEGPPSGVKATVLVSGPRERAEGRVISRTLGTIFG